VPDSEALPRSRVLLLAVASGLAVGNVYYAHPLLDAIADSFGIAPASIGVVVTATQIGYGSACCCSCRSATCSTGAA
jgi:predicted MFS family arabinose efflux permease